MLSRVAAQLYWLSRYLERAENMARILEVGQSFALLSSSQADVEQNDAVSEPLVITDTLGAFEQTKRPMRADQVAQFLAWDPSHPSSIVNCLKACRENARAVRGAMTVEMWECINDTWLELMARQKTHQGRELPVDSGFFEWIKQRSHLFRGVTFATIQRDQPYLFIRLGTYLERADNTARMLDVKYDPLAPEPSPGNEYYEWGALLRSVSAFEIYRRVYRDVITPERVAELLVLRADMPRSLRACMEEVHATLKIIANSQSAETERRAGELHAELHFGRIDTILASGLHEMLTDFLGRTADLGNRISADFLVP
mgnify:CR=1 FL=1